MKKTDNSRPYPYIYDPYVVRLEREGHIVLPLSKRKNHTTKPYYRKRPEPIPVDATPINVKLKEIRSKQGVKSAVDC